MISAEGAQRTFYSLTPGNTASYPNLTYRAFAIQAFNLQNSEADSGIYTLAYYSIDYARNLELVNVRTINLLKRLNINITHQLISAYNEVSQKVLSNVTLIALSNQSSYTCRAKLKNLATSRIIGPANTNGEITKSTRTGTITWIYSHLEDSNYELTLTCFDDYGQLSTNKYLFLIEEDKTISNPQPRNVALKQQQTTISIETISNATCTYEILSPQTNTTGSFEYLFLNNKHKHIAIVQTQEEKVYRYRPTCLFKNKTIGNNGTFIGNNGDIIYFGIDITPPNLHVYDLEDISEITNANTLYNSSLSPTESLTLKFVCNDDTENLRYLNKSYGYGCKSNMSYRLETYYPFRINNQSIIKFGTINNTAIKTFTAPNEYAQVKLILNVSDKGDNSNKHVINLRLRKINHILPIVIICNPEIKTCI